MEALAYQEAYKEYELINGEVYMMARPSFNHIRIEKNIIKVFDRYLQGKKCEAFFEPNVRLSDKDQFIPDVAIVCNPDILNDPWIDGVPDLIVEILSPSTAFNDKIRKKAIYEKCGVKEYWLVDPRGKTVEVYVLKEGTFELDNIYYFYTEEQWSRMCDRDRELAETQKIIKVSLYEDFTVDVAEVFRGVD